MAKAFDLDGLEALFNRVKSHSISVTITPRTDKARPWFVQIDVPTTDDNTVAYFFGETLAVALKMALDEYSRRDAARSVLMESPPRGTEV